jgi:hypothetical protein
VRHALIAELFTDAGVGTLIRADRAERPGDAQGSGRGSAP